MIDFVDNCIEKEFTLYFRSSPFLSIFVAYTRQHVLKVKSVADCNFSPQKNKGKKLKVKIHDNMKAKVETLLCYCTMFPLTYKVSVSLIFCS